jgi:hypothetical protein
MGETPSFGDRREPLGFVAVPERSAAIPTVSQHKLSVAVTQRAAAFSAVHLRLPPVRRCRLDALDLIFCTAVWTPERFSHGWIITRARRPCAGSGGAFRVRAVALSALEVPILRGLKCASQTTDQALSEAAGRADFTRHGGPNLDHL